MTKKKNLLILLGIAFVVAIIATGLFYGLVAAKLSRVAQANQDLVLVAVRDLEPGQVLTPEDAKAVPRAAAAPVAVGFRAEPEVAGLVVMTRIAAGDPISRGAVAAKDSARGAAAGIRPGFRAVSIHVADSSGLLRLLQAGHRVDAQIVAGERGANLRTVLQNLEVLRVDGQPEASEDRPPLPVVTLLATPEEADVLALADAAARVRLLMRHPLDDELTERGPVSLAEVFRRPPRQASRGTRITGTTAPAGANRGGGGSVETADRRSAMPAGGR